MSCSSTGDVMTRGSRHIPRALRCFFREDSGAALIEFAVLLPLTLVTFGLIAEGGRLFWSYQNVITGVRDSARHLGRIAPSDMCGTTPSASIGSYEGLMTSLLTPLSSEKIDVDLDTLNLECVVGDYRVSPAPVAVVTASLTITELPFAPLFQLVGVSASTQIETTVTDRSRVFGP